MANMEERLEATVSQVETDGQKWHDIVQGNESTTVATENGNVPTVAKQLKDIRDAITGGVSDVVAEAEAARDEAIATKNATIQLKSDTDNIRSETAQLKADTLTIKNQATEIFNNISVATDTSISNIQTETNAQISAIKNTGTTQLSSINSIATSQISNVNSAGTTQVNKIKTEGASQIELATEQANLSKYYASACAPAPLGSRLSVPACTKVPDGYEPVWYKNTITRARYPDFFEQLVDTEYLVFTDETTYDSQVSSYGMCASYVKVDNDTVILPLLKNYARSGTTENVGTILNDQFQGHYHYGSVNRTKKSGTDTSTVWSYSENQSGVADFNTLKTIGEISNCGSPRYGTETRPKSYYELVYIKCADISRPLTSEETSEIRTYFVNKANINLDNVTAETIYDKITNHTKNTSSWVEKNNAIGLIKQGGLVNVNSNADFSVTFPTAFSSAPLTLVLTPYNQPTNTTSDYNYSVVAVSVSTTTFKIRYRDSDGDAWRQGYVSWFAVGY